MQPLQAMSKLSKVKRRDGVGELRIYERVSEMAMRRENRVQETKGSGADN